MDSPTDGTPDAATEDVDPTELQRQLDDIKGAMGLDERYPGQRRMWLVYGVTVGLVAIVTNVLFAAELSETGYVALWFVMAAVIVLAQWRLVSGTATDGVPSGPDWRVLVGALLVGLFALWSSLGSLIGQNTDGVLQGAHYFSQFLVFLGLGLLVAGEVLRSQRIRRRDRLPFYVGGAWTLGLAAVIPHVEFLQLFSYSVFGGLFLLHSLAAYALTGSE